MFPWFWIYAPQTAWYWPLSGAVSQDFVTDLFFRGIQPGAGVPGIERKVFDQASYGKQLGWLTDVVVGMLGEAGKAPTEQAKKSMESLKGLHHKIEGIKTNHRADQADAAIALLQKIADDSPEELARVLARYQATRKLSPAGGDAPA
jgi:hypothetical protein